MKTLKLDIETAIKLYPEASKEFKVLLEDNFGKNTFLTKIEERVKTMEDVYTEMNTSEYETVPFKSPKSKEEIKLNTISKLLLAAKCYNEGWIQNWDNKNENKYFPFFTKKDGSWSVGYDRYYDYYFSCGSLVYFSSPEKALNFGKNFIDLYSIILDN